MSRLETIRNDYGVVLWRRDMGEYDRWIALLSENHGVLYVRFGGVNRPLGKLKALSEPMVWGEYRLYFSARSHTVRAAGGRIQSVFPGLRRDLTGTMSGLAMCETALRLCAQHSASPAKYRLLCRALCALDQASSPWVATAFGLKLLGLAGWSLRELPLPPSQRPLWRALHDAPLEGLGAIPWRPDAGRRFWQVLCDHVEAHAERPLRCRDAALRLERFAEISEPAKEMAAC